MSDEGRYGIYQHLRTTEIWPVHEKLIELGFVDQYRVYFKTLAERAAYIRNVYYRFAVWKLQQGEFYTKFCYYPNNQWFQPLMQRGPGILLSDEQMKLWLPETLFSPHLICMQDLKYVLPHNLQDTATIYRIQQKYHDNHDHVFTDEELEAYMKCFRWYELI